MLKNLLQHPIMASLLLGGVSTLFALLWKLVPAAFVWIKQQFLITLQLRDDDLFKWFGLWLGKTAYIQQQKCKNLAAQMYYDESDDDKRKLYFFPGEGTHVFKHNGRRIWLTRRDHESKNRLGGTSREQYFTLECFGRDTLFLENLLVDIVRKGREYEEDSLEVHMITSWGTEWRSNTIAKRPISTLTLPRGMKEDVIADANKFLSSKKWYNDTGIPYRRGYLLYGTAGSGKSTLAHTLATEYNMNLYMLSLSNTKLTDVALFNLLADTRNKSIILIEDIDCIFTNRKNTGEDTGISFSGLLNAIDGVMAQEGSIVIMTTNHIELLDAALIRPGRVDKKYEFRNAVRCQVVDMYKRIIVEHPDWAERFAHSIPDYAKSVAEIQEYLVRNLEVPENLKAFNA